MNKPISLQAAIYAVGSAICAYGCYKTRYYPFGGLFMSELFIGATHNPSIGDKVMIATSAIMVSAIPFGLGYLSYRFGKKAYCIHISS